MHISPDCEYGKHPACDLSAWDHEKDELTGCECSCHARGDVRASNGGVACLAVGFLLLVVSSYTGMATRIAGASLVLLVIVSWAVLHIRSVLDERDARFR